MINFFKHLGHIIKHKHYVFINCVKCGIIWRGIVHDMSKFSLSEFWEGVKYYKGYRSPIAQSRDERGYSLAWLHHKGRNKHHIQYWYDKECKQIINMPYKYAVEFVCDQISACRCYKGKSYRPEMLLEHWDRYEETLETNKDMKNFFRTVYTDMAKFGEKYILKREYMKKMYYQLVKK